MHPGSFSRSPAARPQVYRGLPSFSAARSKNFPAFTAAQILALTPAAWYRLGVGVTTATGVSNWADQSGNGRDLAQGTGTAQPALQGDNSILFDGVQTFLKTSAFTLNQPCSIYILFKQITWTTTHAAFGGNVSTSASLTQGGASPQLKMVAGAGGTGDGNLALNTYGAVACEFNSPNSLSQVGTNGAVAQNSGANSAAGFTLGARGDSTLFANVQVKEVILFAGVFSANTRGQIIGYLSGL